MCGIAGFLGFSDNAQLAARANRIQEHRGPDNQSIWQDDYVAFAHQRLSIIDLSESANQPFVKQELVIIFNGEIYNYKELRGELQSEHGLVFRTESDTEVVLEMFRIYGVNCLSRLVGMFAFAIYDRQARKMFIARDHFGIKPIFYTQFSNGRFAFASELKALVGIPGFDRSLNRKSLVSCLNYLWVSGTETMFNGCYKVPPAHYGVWESGAFRICRYWDYPIPGQEKKDENKIIESLDLAMRASVDRHMVADVPVSCFLSGGLDSSLISAMATMSNDRMSAYTITSSEEDAKAEGMPQDEVFAKTLAAQFGLNHHLIKIKADIVQDLPAIVRALDEPIGDPAAINTYIICKAARQQGVKVLLSGMGADELFGGYRRQKAALMAARIRQISRFALPIVRPVVSAIPVRIGKRGFRLGRWAKRFMQFATLPLEESYRRSYSYYDSCGLRSLLKEGYHSGIEDLAAEHAEIFHSRFSQDPVNQMCATDIQMFMLGLNLTYTDRASMAASVEVRVPFIDRDLVMEAMAIPGAYKIRKGQSKYILKKMSERYLPKEVIYRPKASFGAPIRSWVSKDLVPMVNELLSEKVINKRGIFRYAYVKKMIDDDRKGVQDYAYQIYQLLTLELWFREYLDESPYQANV